MRGTRTRPIRPIRPTRRNRRLRSGVAAGAAALVLAGGAVACADSAGDDDAAGRGSAAVVHTTPTAGVAEHGFVALPRTQQPAPDVDFAATTGSWRPRAVPDGTLQLVFFGYTSCPDVCPLTMADLAGAHGRLDADRSGRVQVVFVSTDPARDSLDRLRGWLGRFDASFVGARAAFPAVQAAARSMGIAAELPTGADDHEMAVHGAQVAVLAAGGRYVGYFTGGTGPGDYAAALPDLLRRYAGR